MAAQLKDKVAIVTGASSGIGEAIAITFASRGAKVTLSGRDQERLKLAFDKAVKASGGHQDRFHTVQGDINDQNIRKAIVAQTVEKFGCLDVLVANAGIALPKDTISDVDESVYDEIMNTNLKSIVFLIQLTLPHLERSKGNIINISSIVSTLLIPKSLMYCLSKAAIDHLTRNLALDLGQKGIRVNSVNPGYVPSRITRDYSDQQLIATEKSLFERIPLKGRGLTLQDLAEATAFLASDDAGFITGENVNVDGGRRFDGPRNLAN